MGLRRADLLGSGSVTLQRFSSKAWEFFTKKLRRVSDAGYTEDVLGALASDDGPCPACAAVWVDLERVHDKGCAYMAWQDKENEDA